MKHTAYASYVARHKWHVMWACFARGLYLRGILHDWHKLLPSEWFPYANHFYGENSNGITTGRDETGYYKPTDTGDEAFDMAWFRHQKRADHHWQWWVMPEDDGDVKVAPMSKAAATEMLCDWIGASRAQGHGGIEGVRKWYVANANRMRLHAETRAWIERELKVTIDLCTGQAFTIDDRGQTTGLY
jgi:hypothetical protein